MEKKLQAEKYISCPHCRATYIPGEVLYPSQVLGQPTNIIKDPLGVTLFNEWRKDEEPLAEDTFYCDYCGKPFVIEIETNFKSRPLEPETDFTTDTVSLI